MAHMSPRLKMRRGRFGLGGFIGPVLRITSPVNAAVVFAPASNGAFNVTFVGTSTDDLDGDISAAIVWTTGSPVITDTGASVTLALSGFGSPDLRGSPTVLGAGSPLGGGISHTVTATSTDAGGKVSTQQVTITVIGD